MSTKPNPREVGLRLRAILRKLGISIEEAAAELGESRANFSNCINGYQLPRPEVAYELEKLLPGVTIQWIFFGDDRLLPGKLARELIIFVEGFREKIWPQEPVPKVPKAPEAARVGRSSKKMARAGE
jgi:transcriptional regulator with XRE-family HTH domain